MVNKSVNQSQNESIYEPTAVTANKRPWLSLEGIQAILVGAVTEICQARFGGSENSREASTKTQQILTYTKELWLQYLGFGQNEIGIMRHHID